MFPIDDGRSRSGVVSQERTMPTLWTSTGNKHPAFGPAAYRRMSPCH